MEADTDKAETSRRNLNWVDVKHLVTEAVRLCWSRRLQWQPKFKPEGGNTNIPPVTLDFEVEAGDWIVQIDTVGFRRILVNLITNSLKYTTSGRIDVTLKRHMKSGPSLELTVKDTGDGMTSEFLERMFLPFTQANAGKPGAGLGLTITRALVLRMQGDIKVSSTIGQGSTFIVNLPVLFEKSGQPDQPLEHYDLLPQSHLLGTRNGALAKKDESRNVPMSPCSTDSLAFSATERGLRVLVVDDSRILLATPHPYFTHTSFLKQTH